MKNHNLSLRGSTGIIFGILSLIFVFGLKFILQSYTSASEGFSVLPISFFQIIIVALVILYIIILYTAITLVNRKRRKKLRQKNWNFQAKFIRYVFISFLIIFGVSVFYLMNIGELNWIIPIGLIWFGIACILANYQSNGNTFILGLSIITTGILAHFFNTFEFIFLAIALGIFPIIYGINYAKK
ncbi:MAG: hypothetical protein R3342_10740 [Lutibacter sp.]|uniref:hypothetical protein n=1 Tax=Lutibacter sp. TaxID=1925666 RepID=UPI00299D0347|nr:hypothetical protein [Lutibacter sp.]MDX1830010.1 hypothetical protein [Lutibacter sp.]